MIVRGKGDGEEKKKLLVAESTVKRNLPVRMTIGGLMPKRLKTVCWRNAERKKRQAIPLYRKKKWSR